MKDKELLLQDLCARLPYGVKVKIGDYTYHVCGYNSEEIQSVRVYFYSDSSNEVKNFLSVSLCDYFPFLRPMSSMTKEEKAIMDKIWIEDNRLVFADPDNIRRYRFYDIAIVDFLNSHHFDYRGLIEKGLALEAPKEMYK